MKARRREQLDRFQCAPWWDGRDYSWAQRFWLAWQGVALVTTNVDGLIESLTFLAADSCIQEHRAELERALVELYTIRPPPPLHVRECEFLEPDEAREVQIPKGPRYLLVGERYFRALKFEARRPSERWLEPDLDFPRDSAPEGA